MYQRLLLVIIFFVLLTGCRVYDVFRRPKPPVSSPLTFQTETIGIEVLGPWWKEFGDETLNCYMQEALANNLNLMQAWDRLAQARANACIVNSKRFPLIDLEATFSQTKSYGQSVEVGSVSGAGGFSGIGGGTFTRYLLNPILTYEIDLWNKIDSRAKAACHEYQAARYDVFATALVLSGTIADLWLTILEQRALLKLINHQIEVNRTQLELLELRFSVGESSALEVYQQRLQLAATIAELPPVRATLKTSINQLYVLIGEAPLGCISEEPEQFSLNLPPFPEMGVPCDLLFRRPDIRVAEQNLMAADYEVAAAIADRFPKLDFRLSYELSAREWSEIFNRESFSILGTILQPLFDGFRRKCEVERRKAIVCENLHNYGNTFLVAIEEVESRVVREKQQLDLLKQLEKQYELAQENLLESRWHYMNGLNDYLTVIAAIQALQNVERSLITEKKNLLSNRVKLYQALGGPMYETNCF